MTIALVRRGDLTEVPDCLIDVRGGEFALGVELVSSTLDIMLSFRNLDKVSAGPKCKYLYLTHLSHVKAMPGCTLVESLATKMSICAFTWIIMSSTLLLRNGRL
jgi:hypothetical protein